MNRHDRRALRGGMASARQAPAVGGGRLRFGRGRGRRRRRIAVRRGRPVARLCDPARLCRQDGPGRPRPDAGRRARVVTHQDGPCGRGRAPWLQRLSAGRRRRRRAPPARRLDSTAARSTTRRWPPTSLSFHDAGRAPASAALAIAARVIAVVDLLPNRYRSLKRPQERDR